MSNRFALGALAGGVCGMIVGWIAASGFREPPATADDPTPPTVDLDGVHEKLDDLLRRFDVRPSAVSPSGETSAAETPSSEQDSIREIRSLLAGLDAKLDLARGKDFEVIPDSVRVPKRVSEVEALADAVANDRWEVRNQVFGKSFAAIIGAYGVPDSVRKDDSGKTTWWYRLQEKREAEGTSEFQGLLIWFTDGIVVDIGPSL